VTRCRVGRWTRWASVVLTHPVELRSRNLGREGEVEWGSGDEVTASSPHVTIGNAGRGNRSVTWTARQIRLDQGGLTDTCPEVVPPIETDLHIVRSTQSSSDRVGHTIQRGHPLEHTPAAIPIASEDHPRTLRIWIACNEHDTLPARHFVRLVPSLTHGASLRRSDRAVR